MLLRNGKEARAQTEEKSGKVHRGRYKMTRKYKRIELESNAVEFFNNLLRSFFLSFSQNIKFFSGEANNKIFMFFIILARFQLP